MEAKLRIVKPGERPFPDMNVDDLTEQCVDVGRGLEFVVHPTGTVGGKAMVMIRGEKHDGTKVIIPVAAMFWDAVQGALIASGLIDFDKSLAVKADHMNRNRIEIVHPILRKSWRDKN